MLVAKVVPSASMTSRRWHLHPTSLIFSSHSSIYFAPILHKNMCYSRLMTIRLKYSFRSLMASALRYFPNLCCSTQMLF